MNNKGKNILIWHGAPTFSRTLIHSGEKQGALVVLEMKIIVQNQQILEYLNFDDFDKILPKSKSKLKKSRNFGFSKSKSKFRSNSSGFPLSPQL